MIHYVTGDATNPIGNDVRIITHVVNDLGAWGAGFVLSISKKWATPAKIYFDAAKAYQLTLGNYQLINVEPTIFVLNLIAQHGLRSKRNPVPLNYDALKISLQQAAKVSKNLNDSIHMPRIGCGLAGGTWNEVEKIIQETLICNDVEVFVYDLK